MHSTLMRVVLSAGLVFLLALPVCAAEPTEEELTFYAAQRHRVEYGKLQDKQKAELKNDYEQFSKVATMIMQKNLLKDDRLYAVAQKIVAFDIWTQRFSQTFNPSEADLKKSTKCSSQRCQRVISSTVISVKTKSAPVT